MASDEEYTYRFIEEVKEDIVDLDKFYFDVTGEQKYADRFEAAFYEAVASLARNPRLFPMWDGSDDVRRYNMLTHNVSIIYLIDDDVPEIIAVKAFHAFQEPERINELVAQRLSKYGHKCQ
jgi:plasmid stabilization system protein ParE